MALPDDLDHDKLAEVGLAVLGLTAFDQYGAVRVWKSFDWDLLNLLHEKGWIDDPRSKAKSVFLTKEGARLARESLETHFRRRA